MCADGRSVMGAFPETHTTFLPVSRGSVYLSGRVRRAMSRIVEALKTLDEAVLKILILQEPKVKELKGTLKLNGELIAASWWDRKRFSSNLGFSWKIAILKKKKLKKAPFHLLIRIYLEAEHLNLENLKNWECSKRIFSFFLFTYSKFPGSKFRWNPPNWSLADLPIAFERKFEV